MKVLVENIVHAEQDSKAIGLIIPAAKDYVNLDSLYRWMDRLDLPNHIMGKGGNHIWVQNVNSSNRLMIISE